MCKCGAQNDPLTVDKVGDLNAENPAPPLVLAVAPVNIIQPAPTILLFI